MKTKYMIIGLAAALLASVGAKAQAPILSETFEGGSGTTLTGWTFANGSQTNKWYVGAAAGNGPTATGSKAAYISNDGGSYSYAIDNSSVVHLYRDVTLSASPVILNFDWQGNGENSYDYLQVFLVETTVTPTAGTQLDNSLVTCSSSGSWQRAGAVLPASGSAKRLVFSWYNDQILGNQPPVAIDNITISGITPIDFMAVSLTAAGTLQGVANIAGVQKLTLTGTVDARDVKFIRDNMPFLTELDLSGANVAAYSGEGGTYPSSYYSYPANTMPVYSFYNTSNGTAKISLTSVKLPTGLTSIGSDAFRDCSGLNGNLTLPTGLTSIGSEAFSNCSGLSGNLTLPTGLTSIGYNAFYNCSGLTSVTNLNLIPQSIDYGTFSNTGSITLTVPTSSLNLYQNMWSYYFNYGNITGGGVLLSVKANAAALGSITGTLSGLHPANTPVSITATPASGYSLLSWTSGGASLGAASSLSFALARDTVITANFGKAGSHDLAVAGTLKDVSGIKTVTHLTLTGAVDARDVKFMRDSMPFLMELDLSGSAVVAYSGEEGTSPWDNSSYPANEMPQHSFYNNSNNAGKTSLIALKLPAGLTSIGGNAFSDCSNLTGTLTLPAGLTSIGDNAFSNCSNLSGTLTLPAGLTSIGYYAFANCSGLSGSLTLPTGLTSIESGTFNNCSGLSGNLTLPAGLTSIGYNAFYNCNGFTSVTNLSLTPQNINYSTFSNTGSITLTVPTSSLSLYKNANGWSDFNNNDITGGGVLLSVKINNAALGSVTGTLSGLYSANASVELAANPASGYSFFGWTSGGASLGTASLLSFVLQKDTAITANFGKVSTYNLAAAGTLKNISGIETVSHLTLTGVIDARDVKFMRDNMPVLTELDLSGATVTAYSGEDGTTFGSYSYPANEMPQYSFYNGSNGTAKTSLTEVKLPAGLTSIGRSAFYNCRNLTGNLALPTELTSIGSAAFYNCSKLTGTLTLPAGLTSIGNSAFYSCSGLSGSLTLPARLTSIGSAAFYSCSGLSGSLTLPAGVTSIGNSAFYSCSGLSGSLTLPAGLTNIGSAAFYNCSGLSGSLTLPAGVTSIGDQAFYSCTGFTSVTNLNLTPQSIGYVFQGVTIGNITLTVPTSAATLYGNANVWKDFGSVSNGGVLLSVKANNAALGSVSGTVSGLHPDNTSVVLTATPASGYSFFGWTSGGASLGTASLLSFTLTKDTVITANFGKVSTHNLTAAGTLKNISGIETVSHLTLTGVIDARDVKFMRDNMPVLTELDLSGAVVTAYSGEDGTIFESYSYPANEMPPYSFYNSSNGTAKASLAAVKLPAGLTSIGSAAFANCSGLSGNLTLPTGLTSIGNSAFSNCSGLSGNLTLPIGLTNIGGEAFYNCSGLSGSLTIPDGLTFISYYTFYGCSGLSSLTLPAGLASISNLAFYSCSGLTSITNLNPVPQSIYDDVFYNANVNSVALRVPAASLADYQNAQVWRNFYSIIGGATLRTTVNNSAWGSVTGADNGWLPDSATVTLTAASAQGYEFGSWTSGSATLGASTSISFTLTQDTVITANFKPLGNVAIYTVTFNINGGGSSVDPLTVASGDRVTKPANPTRSGYTFAGWYSNAELTGSAWNFETGTVTANTTLYAKWAEVTYTVTFEVNGGSRITPQTVAQGDTVVKPADPTRSGYTFAGWYQNSTLTSAWSFAYDVAADITLYARWTPVTCTVTFNATGGSGIGQQQVTPGSTIVEPAKPARSGYVFIGWYKDAALAGVWNFASDVVTASLTLYAKWADENATIYTVTFNADGGSAVSPQQVESGGKVAQVTPPTRAGYTFGGWYSDAALTSLWDVNTAVTGNMTLYARWSSNQPSTDVESHTLGVVKVYPNPTSGMVTVESDGAEVRLYSLQGTLLKRTSGNNLNLSGYPSGVYVLKAGSKTARIVKQ